MILLVETRLTMGFKYSWLPSVDTGGGLCVTPSSYSCVAYPGLLW